MSIKTFRKVQRAVLVVAIYARYSRNPEDKSESTKAQIRRGIEEAQKRWPGCTTRVYADDNYSGTTEDRPDFQRLLADIRRGDIDRVFAKDQSRIARDTQIWDRFRVTCLAAEIEDLDCWVGASSSHVAGKSLPGRMMALVDAEYVEKTRVAVLDHLAMYAAEGRPPGGVCLGYTRDMVEVAVGEATVKMKTLVPDLQWNELIDGAFDAVLAGIPMIRITESFDAEGVPTARNGKCWRPSNLRRLLRSPTLTALRVHVTEARRRDLRADGIHFITYAVAKEHGNVYEGLWEPIVERDKFMAVQRILDEPGIVVKSNGRIARRGIPRGPGTKHMLSKIAQCGRCQCGLTGTVRTGELKSLYICHKSNGGCNGIGINMVDADREAERQFLRALESEEYRNGLAAGDPYADERADLANRIDRIAVSREQDAEEELTGEMTRDDYKIRGKKAAALRDSLVAKLEALPQPIDGDLNPDALLLAWGEADLNEKRRILRLAVDYVEIRPGRGGKFDPDRVKVHMRTL